MSVSYFIVRVFLLRMFFSLNVWSTCLSGDRSIVSYLKRDNHTYRYWHSEISLPTNCLRKIPIIFSRCLFGETTYSSETDELSPVLLTSHLRIYCLSQIFTVKPFFRTKKVFSREKKSVLIHFEIKQTKIKLKNKCQDLYY